MTPHDIASAARDFDLHRRALALCILAEPHRDADEDLPCTRHLLNAASQLAIPAHHVSAPASSCIGGSAAAGALDGAAGVRAHPGASVRPAPATPHSTKNRPRDITPGPAEGAAATARIEGTS